MVPVDCATTRWILVWRGLIAAARSLSTVNPGAATADPDDLADRYRGVGPGRRRRALYVDSSAAHPGNFSTVVDSAGVPRRLATASVESAAHCDIVFCP